MIVYIETFLYEHIFFFHYLVDFGWELSQVLTIALLSIAIWKWKLSGKIAASLGCICLFIAMCFSLYGNDDSAGLAAQYTLIFFFMSAIQEFYHFVKYENK